MTATTIDIHPHIIAGDTPRYPLAPLGGHQSDWSRTRPVTVEQLITAMDEAGVQKAAIVQASTCYGHDNAYVADAVAAHPERFTGVFSVDVLAPDAAERMRFWRDKGLTGLRLFTFGSTMSEQANWLDDAKSYPAWTCAGELGLSICLQMSAKAIPQAINMAERFANIRIVLDHCARPVLDDGPPYSGRRQPVRAGALSQHLSQADAAHFRRGAARQGDAGNIFSSPRRRVRRLAAGVGIELSVERRHPARAFENRTRMSLACLAKADQEWIFAKTAQALYPALAD